MEAELHIAGVVVFCSQPSVTRTVACIGHIAAATVFASTPEGKIIITLETDSAAQTLDYLDAIRALPGVVDVALVYQHAEPRSALEEEIDS